MRPAESDDAQPTSKLDAPTIRIGDAFPDDAEPPPPPARRPMLWLPIVTFVVLLVAAGVVGRFLVPSAPATGSAAAATTSVPASGATVQPTTPDVTPRATAPERPAEALA